jgi:hypothetical protein
VIVPPLGDVTVVTEWTAGPHRLFDPGRRFVARLLADGATAAAPAGPAELAVRLRAGAAALADPAGPLARLRAAALLVPAAAHHTGSAVEITLDDLELHDGTTEDAAAALRASRAPAPYDAEVAETLAAIQGDGSGGDIWLVLDRDQQLPAALTIAARLPGPLLVTGRFARAHWPVLAELPPLRHARLADPAAPIRRWVAGLPSQSTGPYPEEGQATSGSSAQAVDQHIPEPATGATGTYRRPHPADPAPPGPYRREHAGEHAPPGPYWRERAGEPVPPGPWAGRTGLARTVADPDELIASGCTTVVLGVCAADHEVVGRGGATVPVNRVRAAVARLREAGITVLAELWLGAPGIGADRTRAAVATLTGPDAPVDRLVGLRPFDWPVHWTAPHFGVTPVEIDRAPGPDLARHHRFHAPGTLAPSEVQALIAEVGPGLAGTGTLIPARLAAAYLAVDPPAGGSPGIALAPDTVVVKGADDPPEWYAVDLRLGRLIRLDPRVAARLRTGRHPIPEPDALPGVAPAGRTRILDTLVGTGLLVRR